MRGHGIRLAAALLAAAFVATGCTDGAGPNDPLQVTDNPVAATPARSPEQDGKVPGQVIETGGAVTAVAIEPKSRTMAAAFAKGGEDFIAFYALDTLEKVRAVEVPGPVERLEPGVPGYLSASIPGRGRIAEVSPEDPVAGQRASKGSPVSTAQVDGRTLVALRDEARIQVLQDEKPTTVIRGEIASADQILVADGRAAVLDRVRSALFMVHVDKGEIGLGLRAGQGVTNGVADRFGRVLVVDTRAEYLLAFSLEPFVLRQRYPVPGTPYGIAYDPARDLVWVTLTDRNEVVGYDVAGGEPVKKASFPTVRQPNSVTVDPRTGSVMVASAAGEGIQVIEP